MDTTGKIYIAVSIVALIGILCGFSVISRRAPKGTLLGVGISMWVLGQAMSNIPLRETKLLSGLFALSGVIGAVLGIIDLVRKKKDAAPVTSSPAVPPPMDRKDA